MRVWVYGRLVPRTDYGFRVCGFLPNGDVGVAQAAADGVYADSLVCGEEVHALEVLRGVVETGHPTRRRLVVVLRQKIRRHEVRGAAR
eukprot:7565971-Pyramimonas_sp.AAC.3